MIKTRILPAVLAVCGLALFSVPAANAAYTTPPIDADVPAQVAPGSTFEINLSTDPVVCDWSSSFALTEGSTGADSPQAGPTSTGTSYSATFQAPETGSGIVTATCGWDPDLYASASSEEIAEPATPAFYSHNSKTAVVQAEYQTRTYTFRVDTGVAPAGLGGDASGDDSGDAASGNASSGDTNGLLPNTGGAQAAWLIVGLGLIAGGAAFTVVARRRIA